MGQYDDKVERQRLLLQAEEWAEGVKSLHAHSLSSMWYDDRPEDTADGKGVVDKQFNSGLIERTLDDGTIVYFGQKLKGDELISEFVRYNSAQRKRVNYI
jgi:hypothetical protein